MPDVPSLVGALVGATSKSTTSSGSSIIYVLLIVGVGFYFFIYRPQQRKAKAIRERSNAFELGDEVVTAGGIVGHVIDIEGDRVTLETSVGASFVVLRPYILRKLEPPGVVDDTEADGEDESDVDDDAQGEHDSDSDSDHQDGHDEPTGADGTPAA